LNQLSASVTDLRQGCVASAHGVQILVYYFTSFRFSNLHSTMDIMQMPRDWHYWRTVKIECSLNPAMMILALVKWTNKFFHNTHSIIASTSMDRMLNLLLARREIETWGLVICDFASVHFQSAIPVQQSTSCVVFLAIF